MLRDWVTRKESLLVMGLLVAFLGLNLLTASRSPTVWQDEVMFADPAINLVLHGKWSSTAWGNQSSSDFWAGNAPLYPALLSVWLRVFGISITAVRSPNFALTALAAGLLWLWAKRTALIPSSGARFILCLLLLTGQGITFSYRSGRYDALGFLLFAVALLAFTTPHRTLRLAILAAVGCLLPWSGLQLLPYAAILAALSLVLFDRQFLAECVSLGVGSLLGGLLLFSFLQFKGVWHAFRQSVTGLSGAAAPLPQKIKSLLSIYIQDWSSLLLLGLLLLLSAVIGKTTRSETARRIPLFGLFLAVLVPLGLHFLGKYPVYYTWMVYIPLVISVAYATAILPSQLRFPRQLAYAAITGAVVVGFPARLAVTAMQWQKRSYSAVERFAAETVAPADHVFCDFQAYYAVKQRAATIFLPTASQAMSPQEKSRITLLVIAPSSYATVSATLGGRWDEDLGAPNLFGGSPEDSDSRLLGRQTARAYNLKAYRRRNAQAHFEP
jgi:MFS family permease